MNVHRLPRMEQDVASALPRQETPAVQAQEFDLRSVVRVLNARRMTILGIVLLVSALTALWVLQVTPIYTASTHLLLAEQKNKVLDAQEILSGLGSDNATIQNQTQIIRSWALADRVIKKLKLNTDPEFSGAKSGGGLLSGLNISSWFSGTAAPEPDLATANTTSPGTLQRFQSSLGVGVQGRSSVIVVSFSSTSPAKAARIANAVADQYIVDQLETKFEAAKRATSWLNERLGELQEQVRAAEVAVERYKAENGLTEAKDGQSLTGQQLSDLNGQLILARSNLAEQEAKYRQLASLAASGRGVDSVGQVMASSIVTTLRAQQAELIRKEADYRSRYGERHPLMIALLDEKRNLNLKIDEEVRRVLASQQNEVSVARARVSSLEGSLNQIKGSADVEGKARIKLRELEREAESSRTLYNSFLSRFKEVSDADQVQTPDARVIAPATVPTSPSFPNKAMILSIAIVAALILGIVVAFGLDAMDAGFRAGADVEKALGLSNLAVVPTVPGVKSVQDRVVSKPLSAYTEAIRTLYAGIQLSNVDNPPKVLLMTSSVPNEGKTSSSVALARLAALGGQRVILVDGDLRHPSVAKAFDPNRKPEAGLIEVLSGKRDLQSVLVRDSMTDLQYLPIVAPPANPSDLITSDSMRRLIEGLEQAYDLVVIDAAPVIPVSDSRLLSRLVDKVVYVVHWDKTPREAVINGVKMLRDGGAQIAGTILNHTDLRRHAIYGYGYGYGTYSYGSYYGKYYTE
jgi:capsular exopolysaccharide synthesis family protein